MRKQHDYLYPVGKNGEIMKFLFALASIFVSAQSIMAAARQPTQAEHEYIIGSMVGECVRSKCQGFHGFIMEAPAGPHEPVIVQVQEWLYGSPAAATVAVPYHEDDDKNLAQKDGLSSDQIWAKIQVSRNTPITVMLAMERGLGVQPGRPFFLTSDAGETVIIRSLTQQTRQWDITPDLVSQAVASLSSSPNPSLAAYLVRYLEWSTKFNTPAKPDLRTTLALQILASPSVPPILPTA
jgi:hypothetical protein